MKPLRMLLIALAMLVGKAALADCPNVELEQANAMSRAEILASYCRPLYEPDEVVAQFLERQKTPAASRDKNDPLTKEYFRRERACSTSHMRLIGAFMKLTKDQMNCVEDPEYVARTTPQWLVDQLPRFRNAGGIIWDDLVVRIDGATVSPDSTLNVRLTDLRPFKQGFTRQLAGELTTERLLKSVCNIPLYREMFQRRVTVLFQFQGAIPVESMKVEAGNCT